MQDDKQPFVRISIRSPSLDIFRMDESIDIRKLIINKQEKFNVSSANPSEFPTLFNKFRHVCACQWWANTIVLAIGITFFVLFIAFISIFTGTTYWTEIGAIWTFCALFIFFLVLLYPSLIFLADFVGHFYNKKYLASLKSLFLKMQHEGYLEKDIHKYPDSLQMAFWDGSWYTWHQDPDHYLLHWKLWYGFLALKYFFWAYDNLKFPIDETIKWNSWFNRFVGMYCAANNAYSTRIFDNKHVN